MCPKIFFVDNFTRFSIQLFKSLEELALSNKKEFDFFFIAPNEDYQQSDLKKSKNIKKIWSRGHYVKNIFKFLRSNKPELIHISFELKTFGSFFTVLKLPILLILIRFTKTKIVLALHTILVFRENSKWYTYDYLFGSIPKPLMRFLVRIYTKMICNLSHRIIVETDIGKKALMEYFGIKKEKINVIQLGVPQRKNLTNVIKETNLREIIQQKKIILCFGVISPRKRLDDIIKSFEKISNKLSNHILIIAGKTPTEHQWYEKKLKQLSKTLKIEDKIIFTGFLDDEDVEFLFSRAEMAIFAYLPMASGAGALTFAIQYGTPSIVSNTETFQEILSQRGAIFLKSVSENELSQNILKIASNQNLQIKLRSEMEEIAKKFTWEYIAFNHLEIYEKIIARD